MMASGAAANNRPDIRAQLTGLPQCEPVPQAKRDEPAHAMLPERSTQSSCCRDDQRRITDEANHLRLQAMLPTDASADRVKNRRPVMAG
jgi:hypothetical protein